MAPRDLEGSVSRCWPRRKLPFPGAARSATLLSLFLGTSHPPRLALHSNPFLGIGAVLTSWLIPAVLAF